jgi:hypothetical protein
MNEPRRRQGGTILILVLCVLTLLGVWALTQSFYSQSVTVQSQRAQHVERCGELAELALTEALHYLRAHGNNPNHPLFLFMRDEFYPTSLQIALDDLPKAAEVAADRPRYDLSGGVEVAVLRRAYATLEEEERVPHESLGVLRLTCEATGPDGSRREVKEEYGFRAVFMSPTRPFDQFTFFLGDPHTLLTRGAYESDANKTIAMATSLIANRKQNMQKIADETAGSSRTAGLHRIYNEGVTTRWPQHEWFADPPGTNTDGVPFRLHYFSWPLALYTMADEVDLAAWNLPARIEPLVRRAAELKTQVDLKVKEIRDMIDSGGGIGPAEVASQELVDLMLVEVGVLRETLQTYKDFQDRAIELASPAREELMKRGRMFSGAEQQYRATYRFEGPDATARAEEFLSRRPPPQGAVFVQNEGQEPLRVDVRQLQGRLFVTAEGDMHVQAATVEDPSRDVIVLLGLGALERRGPDIQAALVSWSGRFESTGGDMTGSLILDTLYPTSPLASILQGRLTRQDAIQSGDATFPQRPAPDPESILVTLSPMPSYRRVNP